jgi:peptide/nickel transport system substrate-binding protein
MQTKARILRLTLMLLLVTALPSLSVIAQSDEDMTYNEAPILAELVEAGELPPVAERLPDEPFVLEPLDAIGTYGGTLNVYATDNSPWNELTESPERGPLPLRMENDGTIIPDILRDYEQAEDNTSITLYLRPGMKWSDGSAFTSADFMFLWHDIRQNDQIDYPAWTMRHWDIADVQAPDEHTVIYEFTRPTPRAVLDLLHWRGGEWSLYQPSEYLKQWHIDYNPEADELAQEEGFDTWFEAFNWHIGFVPQNDINKPTTHPWRMVRFDSTVRVYERNPYFHQVDSAGNQLPYVDRVVSQIVDSETYNLEVISGQADVAYLNTTIDNFTLYKQNEQAGNYVVNTVPGTSVSDLTFRFNFNSEDPEKRDLYRTPQFRQALSLAIDREEINDLILLGLGEPRQYTVPSGTSYLQPEWETAFADFDPERANQMLDDLGLTERNADGIRLLADGEPLQIVVSYAEGAWSGSVAAHELVQEYWREIGVDMQIRPLDVSLFRERENGTNWDVHSEKEEFGEMYAYLGGSPVTPVSTAPWITWYDARREVEAGNADLSDFEGGELPGEEPPQEIIELLDLALVEQDATVYGTEEYEEISRELFQRIADNTYAIGTVGETPTILIARPNLRNLPQGAAPWFESALNISYYSAQWFYDES